MSCSAVLFKDKKLKKIADILKMVWRFSAICLQL